MNPDDVKPKTDSKYTPPSDPSQYIRTYAKDVAMLTNTPTSVPSPVQAPARSSFSNTTQQVTHDGVGLTEYDASPIEHRDNPSSPKEFKSEVVALSEDDSEGIFTAPSESKPIIPQPVAMMPQASMSVRPTIEPIGSIPPSLPTPSEESNVAPQPIQQSDAARDREEVLARLRAKLASRPPEPPAPVVQQPVYIPPPTPAPKPEPIPVFIPPIPPVYKPPAESVTQLPKPPIGNPSPIHTFSSDFSDRIDTQRASTFSVLAAQHDAGPVVVRTEKKPSRLVPILAGVVLLLCGIGVVTGAYIYNKKNTSTPTVAGIPSLLTFDESVEVKGSGSDIMQAVADVAGQASVAGNVIVTYITTPGVAGTDIPQPGGALISQLPLGAPSILMRNIDPSSTVGVINAGSESHPFMVLKVTSYERTFAGMLAWEPDMQASLSTFFPPYVDGTVPTVGSTSSSSPVLSLPVSNGSALFSDGVVANHDVRILKDARGRSLMLYGYQGKDILIIARDEAAFTALIARISATPAQ